MKIFFDTEFTGLHKNTTLISIGLVSENGNTFYAEFTDYDKSQVDDWIQENVLSNLLLGNYAEDDYKPYQDSVVIRGAKSNVEQALSHWLYGFGKNEQLEMWSDCLSYDWVLFCDIWGHAFKIPKFIHYIPYDICTLFKAKGIDPDIKREEYAGNYIKVNDAHNWGGGKKHNSLWDAYVIKACHNILTDQN